MFRCLIILLLFQSMGSYAQNDRGAKSRSINANAKGTYHAVIVGISDYKQFEDLNYADDDAKMVYEFMERHPDFDTRNIQILLDSQATETRINEALKKAYYDAKQGDKLFFYFAGHGDVAKSQEYGYLLFYNAPTESNYDFEGAWSTTLLKQKFSGFWNKEVKVVIIVDACRSANTSKLGRSSTLNALSEEWPNSIKLLACRSDERALEFDDLGHGAFTYYLLRGLSGLAQDQDSNNVYVEREIRPYVTEKVTTKTKLNQTPEIVGRDALMTVHDVLWDNYIASNSNSSVTNDYGRGRGGNLNESKAITELRKDISRGEIIPPLSYYLDNQKISVRFKKSAQLHNDITYTLSYAFHRQELVAGSGKDKRLTFYKIYNGETDYIDDEFGGVLSSDISEDSELLAYGNWVDQVRIRDMNSRELIQVLKGHNSDVRSVKFSRDGQYLVSGDEQGNTFLWHKDSLFQQRYNTRKHDSRITGIEFLSDNQYLTASKDGKLLMWSVQKDQPIHQLEFDDAIEAISLSPDKLSLLVGLRNKKVLLLDMSEQSGVPIYSFTTYRGGISALDISPDGKHFLLMGRDYLFDIHSLKTSDKIQTIEGSDRGITAGLFTHYTSQIFATNYDGDLNEFEIVNPRKTSAIDTYLQEIIGQEDSEQFEKLALNEIIVGLQETAVDILNRYLNGVGSKPSLYQIENAIFKLHQARFLLKESNLYFDQKLISNILTLQSLKILEKNEQSSFEEAFVLLDSVKSLDTYSVYPFNVESLIQKRQNELERAKSSLNYAIEQIPKWTEPKGNLGLNLIWENRFKEAEALFNQIIEINPNVAKGYLLMAQLSFNQGKFRSAEDLLQIAREKEPEKLEVHLELIRLDIFLGNVESAEGILEQMSTIDPKSRNTLLASTLLSYYKYKNFNRSGNMRDELISSFDAIYHQNSEDRNTLLMGLKILNLLESEDEQGEKLNDEVISRLLKSDKLFPFDPQLLGEYVLAFDKSNADQRFQSLQRTIGDQRDLFIHWAKTLQKLDNQERAHQVLVRAQELIPNNYWVDITLMEGLLESKDQLQLQNQYIKIDSLYPQSSMEGYLLGMLDPASNEEVLLKEFQTNENNFYLNTIYNSLRRQGKAWLKDNDFSSLYSNIRQVEQYYETIIDERKYILGKDLRIISELKANETYIGQGLVATKNEDQYGVRRLNGNIVLTPDRTSIQLLFNNWIIATKSNGKKIYELYNTQGVQLMDQQLIRKPIVYPNFAVVRSGGQSSAVGKDGKVLVPMGNYRIEQGSYRKNKVIMVMGEGKKKYYSYEGICLNCR